MQRTKWWHSSALSCWFSMASSAIVMTAAIDGRAEPHYRIALSVPNDLPNCNDLEGFRGVLDLALTRNLLEPPETRVLDVRIEKPRDAPYVVHIHLKELDGTLRAERQLTYPEATECFKVLHSTAIAAAVELDRDAPPEASRAPPKPLACPPCEVPQAPAPKPLRHWFVGAGGRIDMGVAPDQLVGGHFIVGWRRSPKWSFEVHGRATLPRDTRPLGPTVVRVHSIASLAFVPCYRIRILGLCGEFIMGNMWFTFLNLKYPQLDTALFGGAGIRGFLEQPLSERWSVRMDVDLFVPFMPADVADDAQRGRWETSFVSGSANMSLFVWF